MKKKERMEELQSRREFFKNAAKSTLPFLGMTLLLSMPNIANALSSSGCEGNCKGSCAGHCENNCAENGCKGNCSGTCSGSCSSTNK